MENMSWYDESLGETIQYHQNVAICNLGNQYRLGTKTRKDDTGKISNFNRKQIFTYF